MPTLETLAAAALLREHVPGAARARGQRRRPDGAAAPRRSTRTALSRRRFRELFTADDRRGLRASTATRARSTRSCTAARTPERFHVRGFNEQGTTTTPFDMVVLNEMSRYHLVHGGAAPRRGARPPAPMRSIAYCDAMLARHQRYVREHFEDMPEIRDWGWPG